MLNDYPEIGSVCSGGRYDNLAEYYTTQKLPGVGISIGLTRLFYQLREANIIQPEAATLSQVLVIPINEDFEYCIKAANELRDNGIISEVYVEDTKIAKKLNYANKLGIPYVILIGSDEVKSNLLTFKDMKSGEQDTLTISEIIAKIK
jgi:histidyl-tRNA synthetase